MVPTAVGILISVVAVVVFGSVRWSISTKKLRQRLERARGSIAPKVFAESELAGLPAPVQRYFRAALKDGQQMVAAVDMEHSGTFNMGETTDRWKTFRSRQRVVTHRPGFVWDAVVTMMPGVPVRVHDAYVAGEGILQAAVLGLVTAADVRGTEEIALGELMRFFAEAAWYPTALLPSQGVVWTALNDHTARATMRDGAQIVTSTFSFGHDGMITAVDVDLRGRAVAGEVIPTPWRGRFWNYVVRDGMSVPLDGEVAWRLPEGSRPYWRGHLTKLEYEFAP